MAGTWEKIEGWGEQHPVALGIGIFAIGAVLLYVIWPSSSAAPAATSTSPSDAYYNAVASMAASGNQLQVANLQAQQDANATQAQLTAAQTASAAQVSVATINGQTATAVAGIQAAEDNYDTAQQAASTQLASTLNAQVQTASYATQQNIAGLNAAAATQQAKIAANTSIANTQTNAQLQESSVAAQNQTFLQAIAMGGTSVPVTLGAGGAITYSPIVTSPGQGVVVGGSVIGQPTGPVNQVGPYGLALATVGGQKWYVNQQGTPIFQAPG